MSKNKEKKDASKEKASEKKSATKKETKSEKVEKTTSKKTETKTDTAKKTTSKKEAPKKEESKKPTTKKEEPKKEAPKKEAPKKEEAPKVEIPKKEEIKETPKKETPKKEVLKKEAPKKEETPKEEEKIDMLLQYGDIKLFNTWSYRDVIVTDPGLKAYISLRPVITPHTGGRYEHQRFKKAEMPIIERLVNKLMRKRKGTGKKERMIKAVKVAFEIINLKTNKNPIQVLIDAIQNAAPREEVTRITYGGMAQLQSVDVAPMRRVDIALTNIVEGTYKKAFNNILTAEEILAQELIDAADNKTSSYAISKMQEVERVALSAR